MWADAAQITAFAETLRKALRAPIAFNDREMVLTASIGVALGEAGQTRAEELLADAELAMVHGKRSGGDRIEVFKPTMRVRRMDKLALETELKRAIERFLVNALANLSATGQLRLGDVVVVDFSEEMQKLAFYRDDSEAARAAAALDALQAMNVTSAPRIAA